MQQHALIFMKIIVTVPYTTGWIQKGVRIAEAAAAIGIRAGVAVAVPGQLQHTILPDPEQDIVLKNSCFYINSAGQLFFFYRITGRPGCNADDHEWLQPSPQQRIYLPCNDHLAWASPLLFEQAGFTPSSLHCYDPDQPDDACIDFFLQSFQAIQPPDPLVTSVRLLLKHFDLLQGKPVSFTGRILRSRKMKLTCYADCLHAADSIQVSFEMAAFEQLPEAGDIIMLEGTCYRTRKNEPTVRVTRYSLTAPWAQEESYASVLHNSSSSGNRFFQPGFFAEAHAQTMLTAALRSFLDHHGFYEIFTPLMLDRHNGGNSYPTEIFFKSNRIGFARTTLEDQMKGYIAGGFDKIYQAGPAMRGGNEFILAEAYSRQHTMQTGTAFSLSLIQHLHCLFRSPGQERFSCERLDFFETFASHFGEENIYLLDSEELPQWMYTKGIVSHPNLSAETAVDQLAKYLCKQAAQVCLLEGFPVLSSPLYTRWHDPRYNSPRLERSKLWFGGTFIMDMGVEETDSLKLAANLAAQQQRQAKTGREDITGSGIEKIIQGAVPSCFGFGLSLSRLAALFSPIAPA